MAWATEQLQCWGVPSEGPRAAPLGGLCQPLTQDLGFAGLPARHWLSPNGVSCTGQQAGHQCSLAHSGWGRAASLDAGCGRTLASGWEE